MLKAEIFKDFLTELSSEIDEEKLTGMLRCLEMLLADPEASHKRIAYLEALADSASEFPEIASFAIKDPLTKKQCAVCIEKGLDQAYRDGDVTKEELARLAHSVEGIRSFIDALLDIPEEHLAACWGQPLEPAFELPRVDLTSLFNKDSTEDSYREAGILRPGIKQPLRSRPQFRLLEILTPKKIAVMASAMAAVVLLMFIVTRSMHPNLIVEFNLASEQQVNSSQNLTSKVFGFFGPSIAHAAEVPEDKDGNFAPGRFTGLTAVPAGLRVRLIDNSGKEVASTRTNRDGKARFRSITDGFYTLVLDGNTADYYIPVEISQGMTSKTGVVNTRPEDRLEDTPGDWLIDAKTIHDLNGDGKPDDDFSYGVYSRPVDSGQGGVIRLHKSNKTSVDSNGNGSLDDPEDKKEIIEPDDDGIPSDAGDGDEDNDGILDNIDPDIDGDNLPNESDPDIDGDGLLNETDPYPNGITPLDDFEPPVLLDGSPYTGILSVEAYDPSTASVKIVYPSAKDEGSDLTRYKVFWSYSTPIDFNTTPYQLNCPSGINPISKEPQFYKEILPGMKMDRDLYFAVRVIDEATPANEDKNTKELMVPTSDWENQFAPIPVVTVDHQTQIAGEPVYFFVDGSNYPDVGNIIKHEWDFDNDGTFEEQGPEITYTWQSTGAFPVQYRVTDDEGVTCALAKPLIVYIHGQDWAGFNSTDPVKTWGGSEGDRVLAMTLDSSDNLYVLTTFEGNVDFDPGPGIQVGEGVDNWDMALSKFDNKGLFQWIKVWRSPDYDEGNDVVCDSHGNVYITGRFAAELDFDPGPGGKKLIASPPPNHDTFLLKLNNDGELIWVKFWRDPGYGNGRALAIDKTDNVYVTGSFGGKADFDPGPSECILQAPGESIVNTFISKFSENGDFIWARVWGCPDKCETYGKFLALDREGNPYVMGDLSGTVELQTNEGLSKYSVIKEKERAVLMVKLTSQGDLVWARSWAGQGGDSFPYDLKAADSGGVYAVIGSTGFLEFTPPTAKSYEVGTDGRYVSILQFDPSGNLTRDITWAGNAEMKISPFRENRGFVIAGKFSDRMHFESASGEREIVSKGGKDVFIGTVSPDGMVDWVKSLGEVGEEEVYDLHVSALRQIYVVGSFDGVVDFDPGPAVVEKTSNGGSDVWLAKFDLTGSLAD